MTKEEEESVEAYALKLGIVSFEWHQLPADPEAAKRTLKARSEMAQDSFRRAKEAGLITLMRPRPTEEEP